MVNIFHYQNLSPLLFLLDLKLAICLVSWFLSFPVVQLIIGRDLCLKTDVFSPVDLSLVMAGPREIFSTAKFLGPAQSPAWSTQ